MKHCDKDQLIAAARRELSPARVVEVETHAADCAECKAELAWLRAERTLLQRRAGEVTMPAGQWGKIADRIGTRAEREAAPPARRPSRLAWLAGGGALLVAAAAAMLLVLPRRGAHEKPSEPAPTRPEAATEPDHRLETVAAIEQAEKDYERAIDLLEAEYAEQRTRLQPEASERRDAELERMREELHGLRGIAGDDVDGRLRMLHASAQYVRSMQTIVLEEPQASAEMEETP